ncbi:MAG: sugar kinase [Acidimicrobiia bacterium]
MSGGLFTFGEGMLRFSVSIGDRLDDARSFRIDEGGAEANVAVAVARMGHKATWFSQLPANALGKRISSAIGTHGVDVSAIRWVPTGRVGIYYLDPSVAPRKGRVIYDRQGSTVCDLTVDDVPWARVEGAAAVHLTGITPALSESLREVTREVARRARVAGAYVTFDVNYRSQLWPVEVARPMILAMSRESDLTIIGREDARALFGIDGESCTALTSLKSALGTNAIVLTLGDRGSVWSIDGRQGEVSGLPTQVVDEIGAGDAFAAGIVLGVLEGDIEQGIQKGTAMAALTMGWHGDRFWGEPGLVSSVHDSSAPVLDR